MTICSNCPAATIFCKGRCRACYRYWRRTGSERPLVLAAPIPQCSNCGTPRTERRIIKGRCHLCYRHWLRYGTERNPSRPAARSPICINCQMRPTHVCNRCKVCYWYWWRTGTERPPIIHREALSTPHRCGNENCTKVITRTTRCDACRRFLKKHGRERTVEECKRISYSHAKVKPRKCKICGNPKLSSRGRCGACGVYYKRNGKDRPRWLWDDTMGCLTCGVPLRTQGHRQRSGRCIRCYRYLCYHGTERPRSDWDIGTYGWCDCGMRADHQQGDKPLCTLCKDKEKNK